MRSKKSGLLIEALVKKCSSSVDALINNIASYGQTCMKKQMEKDFYEKEVFPEKLAICSMLNELLTFMEHVPEIIRSSDSEEEACKTILACDMSSLSHKEVTVQIPETTLLKCSTVQEVKEILCSIAEELVNERIKTRNTIEEFFSKTLH